MTRDDSSTEDATDGRTRRQVVAALGGAAATGLAGCAGSSDGADPATATRTETAADTQTPTATATDTATATAEPEPQFPQRIEPDLSDNQLRAEYENSIVTPGNYHEKMENATHEETEVVGLDNIAAAFAGDRVEQVKNVAAAAAAQYDARAERGSELAMVKAVNDTFDWFTFEDGCRVDLETMIEGQMALGMSVNTFEDENGELRRDLMNNATHVTRPSREWLGPYSESEFMDSGNDGQVSSMEFEIMESIDWDIPEGTTQRIHDGWGNFLWGARNSDANLVFSREGGLLTTEKLRESPEVARDVKDEVNEAYATAEMEGYDLSEDYLAVEEEAGELVYNVVTEDQAEEIAAL
ncbi:hypothetical protein [Haloarchaeobius baliensis]|uniref:hypothetical protein n=1 Tax=Haloarchaeobius baliensis TaxID=1670458 RepID=UPI003F881FFD